MRLLLSLSVAVFAAGNLSAADFPDMLREASEEIRAAARDAAKGAAFTPGRAAAAQPDKEVAGLIAALKGPDGGLRISAINRLRELGPKAAAAVPDLLAIVEDERPGADDYAHAAKDALVSIGPEAYESEFPKLMELIGRRERTPEWRVSDWLILTAHLWPRVKEAKQVAGLLVQTLREDQNLWAVEALNAMGTKAYQSELLGLREALQNPKVFFETADLIAAIGPEAREAVPDLVRLFSKHAARSSFRNMYPGVQLVLEKVAQVVGRLEPEPSVLVPLLSEILADKSSRYRADAPMILLMSGLAPKFKEAVPMLVTALKDEQLGVRSWSVIVLEKIGPAAKDAVPALTELALHDNFAGVREDAKIALIAIQGWAPGIPRGDEPGSKK